MKITPLAEPIVEQATNIGIINANGPNILLANSLEKTLCIYIYIYMEIIRTDMVAEHRR